MSQMSNVVRARPHFCSRTRPARPYQEQLGQVAEVLAVNLLLAAVHLEEAHRVALFGDVAVDLIAWWMPQLHFAKVALQLVLAFEERQVELAKVELFAVVVLLGEGRKVPRVDLPAPQLNLLDVLDLGVLLVLAQRCLVKLRVVIVLVVILAELALLRARLVFVAALLSLSGQGTIGCDSSARCQVTGRRLCSGSAAAGASQSD